MNTKSKNSGFTLVELLVSIIILGIITALALPGVRNLQAKNRAKKYETYEKNALSAIRLYTDSYKDDMFDEESSSTQCKDISYKDIENKKLLKEYNGDPDVKCIDEADSKIRVLKYSNGKYEYQSNIVCRNSKTEKVVYNSERIKGSCDGGKYGYTDNPPEVTLKLNSKCAKKPIVEIVISSKNGNGNGIENNTTVNYYWQRTSDEKELGSSSMTLLNPDLKPTVSQSVYLNKEIAEEDGEYKLCASGTVKDVYGNEKTFNSCSEVPVKLDTTPPTITEVDIRKWQNNSSAPSLSNYSKLDKYANNWTNKNVFVVASATDTCNNDKIDYKYEIIDPTSKSTKSSGRSVSVKDSGHSYITYTACDEAQNCATYDKKEIKIDKIVPTISIVNPKEAVWTNQNFQVNVNATDSLSGIDGYKYYYASNTTRTAYDLEKCKADKTCTVSTDKSQFTTTAFSKERNENAYIEVCDNAGNCSNKATKIQIDKTPPTCTVSKSGTIGDNSWYKTNVTLNLSTTETGGSNLASKGLTNSSAINYNGNTTNTQGNTKGITWYGFVKDKAGNTGTCNTGSFKVDSSAPNIPSSDVHAGTCSAKGTKITDWNTNKWRKTNMCWSNFKATDNGDSDIARYEYSTDGKTKQNNLTTSYDYSNGKNSTYYIRAVDKAGNASGWSKAYYFKIDTVAPAAPTVTLKSKSNDNDIVTDAAFNSLSSYINDTWKSTRVVARASGEDKTGSGFAYIQSERINDGVSEGPKDNTNEVVWRNVNKEGTAVLKFKMCDKAGNCSSTVKKTIKLDRTPPSPIRINVNNTNKLSYFNNVTCSGGTYDNVKKVWTPQVCTGTKTGDGGLAYQPEDTICKDTGGSGIDHQDVKWVLQKGINANNEYNPLSYTCNASIAGDNCTNSPWVKKDAYETKAGINQYKFKGVTGAEVMYARRCVDKAGNESALFKITIKGDK